MICFSFRSLQVMLLLAVTGITGYAARPALPGTMPNYFERQEADAVAPDSEGFIRRWLLLEPVEKPNRSNTVFTDSYLRDAFSIEYFKGQSTDVPADGDVVKVDGKKLRWHALDSKLFNGQAFPLCV